MQAQMNVDNTVSSLFCAPDADLIFRSSDGVIFKVHRKYVESLSDGFSAPAMVSNEEIASLSEKSATLEILFQYMYPQRQPDLEVVEFEVLKDLAEAAEKYQVFPALEVCKSYMRHAIPAHPVDVLEYAAKHDHTLLIEASTADALDRSPPLVLRCAFNNEMRSLMNDAAVLTLTCSTGDMSTCLPQRAFLAWIMYMDQWRALLQHAQKQVLTRLTESANLEGVRPLADILTRLHDGPGSLSRLSSTFPDSESWPRSIPRWKQELLDKIATFSPFTYFLDQQHISSG